MLRKLGFAIWFISIGIYRLTFKRWCYGVGGYAPGMCVILVYARIVYVHSELCAKASLVHTQLRPWSAERLDELMQWYSSLQTLRVQNLEMKLLPSLPFPLS